MGKSNRILAEVRRVKPIGFILFLTIILGLPGRDLCGQSVREVGSVPGSLLTVSGTSNLHDWVMKTGTIHCSAGFVFSEKENRLLSVRSFSFSLPVNTLKSGHEVMDNRTYTTLKADQYPAIGYKLTSVSVSPRKKDQYLIEAQGVLTIAGVDRKVSLSVACMVNADGSVECTGKKAMKMTDFGIKPPAFMMGALTTGDEVVIDFTVKFKPADGRDG